jgi:hypothetical protein
MLNKYNSNIWRLFPFELLSHGEPRKNYKSTYTIELFTNVLSFTNSYTDYVIVVK